LQEFNISNTGGFIPGSEVEIKLRYEGNPESEATVFKGVIIKHGLEATRYGSFLSLELKDPAVKLCSRRNSAVFKELTDDQIIKQIIENNGLTPGELSPANAQHKELVQYYVTDWDFILARAEANGLLVYVHPDGISLADPAQLDTSTPAHIIAYGIDEVYRFTLEANSEGQYEKVESSAWNIAELAMSAPLQSADFLSSPGDFDPVELSSAAGIGDHFLQSSAPLIEEEIQAWANAHLRKSRMAMVYGNISIKGQANIFPLEVLEIGGVGDHFNGNVIISGVRHRVSTKGWITDIQFGLKPEWHMGRPDVISLPAGGLLPGIRGLQVAIVDAFEKDPDEQFRVRVKMPSLGEDADPIWARLATPDAGNERGFFFLPETGDEVILGFLNEDPRHPVILGSLFSSGQPPPVPGDNIDENNFLKGIYSKEGIKIEWDDENKALVILAAEEHQITINEAEKLIEIKDVNGNTITMNDSGITIKSAKDLIIEAAQNVEIKGQQVDVK
jgi:Rhs element Vgr protein